MSIRSLSFAASAIAAFGIFSATAPTDAAADACSTSKNWSTRADNSDLITLKPRDGDTYFEFPRQEGLSQPLDGPETLVFYNRFKAPAGVARISFDFDGDGNNTGFEIRLLDSNYQPIGKKTGKGKFKHTFDKPSEAQITVRTKASGKTWGTLGHVKVCAS